MKTTQPMTAPRVLEAVVKAPGGKPRVTLVSNTLEALQSIVGGYIEVVGYSTENVIVCNEEGRLLGLPENTCGICGTFLVLGKGQDGEFGSCVKPRLVCELLREKQPLEERT